MPLSRFASHSRLRLFRSVRVASRGALGWALFLLLALIGAGSRTNAVYAQIIEQRPTLGDASSARARALRFLAGRTPAPGNSALPSIAKLPARKQAQALVRNASTRPATAVANLAASWQPLGPMTVNSLSFGAITGRITSIALDPNDATGNTVWLGTTGGGVWKSTNAAGPLASVTFAPLTDTLAVFSPNEGAASVPSLSIGAVAVQPLNTAIVLAGTGDPNEATDSYYGEGILRSADGGQTWTLATQSYNTPNGNYLFQGLATAGLAWSTATPTLAVAAMMTSLEGEVVGAPAAETVPGLYFSADAGVTWQMATVYDGAQVVQTPLPIGGAQRVNNATAVVWDAQRGMFFAALAFHGYYGSADGQTWHRLTHQPGTGLTTINCPVGTNGSGSTACPIARGALAVQPETGDLYALTVDGYAQDEGLWQDFCSPDNTGACAVGGPFFAHRVDAGALEIGQGSPGGSTVIPQGTYDLALAAAPAPAGGTLLFAGTIDLYRCTLGAGASACNLRNTTNAGNGCNATAMVAPAQHALAVLAQGASDPLLFLGNDGGLWRSADGVAETGPACAATDASHFENLNLAIGAGGSLAEVVGFAQDPVQTNTLLAGLGANGSAATETANSSVPWAQLSAGEGGYPQIDSVTASNWYVATGAGLSLVFCDLGVGCGASNFLSAATVGEPQVSNDAALLDATTLLDPQLSTSLLAATCRVWRGPAQSGAGWKTANALSPSMDGDAVPCTLTSALIRSMAAGGPSNPSGNGATQASAGSEVIYAGMAGLNDGGAALSGHIFVTTSANTASAAKPWIDAANSPVTNSTLAFNAAGFDVSSLAVDSHDPTGATVYATVMGFGVKGSVPHIYGSTDFGAHWTDLTANLPNAPANSVIVDPNDANTVYIAMDSGVYATRAVSTCATTNCWSPLGAGLPNSPVTEIEAGAGLPTGNGSLGVLRAATYGRGMWQVPLLSALSTLSPQLVANPTQVIFPLQQQGSESAAQTITFTSSGNAPLTISKVMTAGDFVEADTCSGQTLPVGTSCTVDVQFAPAATGARSGLLTVFAGIAGGQVTVALEGTASAPASVVLTPIFLIFPSTLVNQTAASEIVTVSNTGGEPATLQLPSVTGDFAIDQSTCGTSLASQTGCSIVITFTPTASGNRMGVLTITGSAGVQTAQLSGTGQAPPTDTLAPLSLTFAQAQVGSSSAAQQVTLTNSGDVALTLVSGIITSGDFKAANSCSSSLAPHSTCAINVSFVPTAVGSRTGTLTVTDEVRYQTVSLTGVGVAPPGISVTPSTTAFGAVGVGLNSAPQTVTITNNGGFALTLTPPTVSGDFGMASSTCGATLNVGDACVMVIFFAPSAPGARTGSLNLTDTAPGGEETVILTGTGIDFALTPNGATSVTVASGGVATFPVALSSLTGLSGSVALACTGVPAHSVCAVTPAAPSLGETVQVSVVVQTGMTSAELIAPKIGQPGGRSRNEAFWAFLPFFWLGWRGRGRVRRRVGPLIALASACLLIPVLCGLAGCASARIIPTGAGSGGGTGGGLTTPSGTYNVTLTGTTAGITHAVQMSLTIQ